MLTHWLRTLGCRFFNWKLGNVLRALQSLCNLLWLKQVSTDNLEMLICQLMTWGFWFVTLQLGDAASSTEDSEMNSEHCNHCVICLELSTVSTYHLGVLIPWLMTHAYWFLNSQFKDPDSLTDNWGMHSGRCNYCVICLELSQVLTDNWGILIPCLMTQGAHLLSHNSNADSLANDLERGSGHCNHCAICLELSKVSTCDSEMLFLQQMTLGCWFVNWQLRHDHLSTDNFGMSLGYCNHCVIRLELSQVWQTIQGCWFIVLWFGDADLWTDNSGKWICQLATWECAWDTAITVQFA